MNPTQLTPAFKVGIQSTCSGAWPVIYEPCCDPETGREWNREIARGNSVFVETETHSNGGKAETWNENPSAFERRDDYDENIAVAYQLAAAPTMADALRAVLRSRSASEDLKELARFALEAAEPPSDLPQEHPETE